MDGNQPFAHNEYHYGSCDDLVAQRRRARGRNETGPPSDAELHRCVSDLPQELRYEIAIRIQRELEERSWAFYRIGCMSRALRRLTDSDYQILLDLGGLDALLEQAEMPYRVMQADLPLQERITADTEFDHAFYTGLGGSESPTECLKSLEFFRRGSGSWL